MLKKHLVYISHPSGGKNQNTLDTEKIVKILYNNNEIYNNFCFVSPINMYGFMYNDFDYAKGLSFCTDLLKHCKLMLVFGNYEQSTGCKEEIKLCKKLNIPYLILGNSSELSELIENGLNNKMLNSIK